MRVFKVVANTSDGRLRSAVEPLHYSGEPYGSGVEYKPGLPAKAPDRMAERGYHLLAFATLDDALRVAGNKGWNHHEVWCAEAEGVVEPLPQMFLDTYSMLIYRDCESSYQDGDGHSYKWPEGTVMAKEITLTERIGYVTDLIQRRHQAQVPSTHHQ